MKTPKKRWVMANYSTGEIVSMVNPTTKNKAMKRFKEYLNDTSDFVLFENIKQITPIGGK